LFNANQGLKLIFCALIDNVDLEVIDCLLIHSNDLTYLTFAFGKFSSFKFVCVCWKEIVLLRGH